MSRTMYIEKLYFSLRCYRPNNGRPNTEKGALRYNYL